MVDMECSNSSSQLCDETDEIVTRMKEKILKHAKSKEIDFKARECSKETYELFQRCADYVRLYYLRYQEKRTPKKIIKRLLELVEMCKIPLKGESDPIKYIIKMVYPEFRNLLMFLNEVDALETQVGRHVWDLYYISSADLFAVCEKSSMHFSIRVISVMRRVFDAVRKRQWEKAVLIIGNIRLVSSNISHEKNYMKSALKAFSFYFPYLYHVVLQRYLESGYPLKIISKNFFQVLTSFLSTCLSKNQAYDYSEFYLTQFLIFHFAHQLWDGIEALPVHNLTHQDPEADYEKWVYDSQKDPIVRLCPALSSFFSTIVDSLLRTTHVPLECVGVLPVLIRLAEALHRLDELRDILAGWCGKDVSFLFHVTRMLNSLQLHHISGFLFSRAMELIYATDLASYEFVVDIVEQQSLDPASHGAFENLVALNLRILFNFMDHGRNRSNARAWGLLKANLLYAETEIEAFLSQLWQDRRCWWPAFHSVTVDKETRKARKSVFAVLNSLK